MPFEADVVSAHRMPDEMLAYGREAAGRGLQVIIAGAGGAAHLPGMLAAVTPLPVIGVPVALRNLDGLDSLLSIVQMPAGVPVATVAVGNARNAGLLAVRILAASDEALRQDDRLPGAGLRDLRQGEGQGRARRGRGGAQGRVLGPRPGRLQRFPGSLGKRSTPHCGGSERKPGICRKVSAGPGPRLTRCARRLSPGTSPVCSAAKASRSAVSSATTESGLPLPWPVEVSIRASTGASPAWQRCISAVNLKLCAGTTRSSWSPVSTSVAGYDVPGARLCSGE